MNENTNRINQEFSVLMSLYSKEKPDFLRQSLESIFNQTLRANEVILVEDGPITTELTAVINEFKRKYPELKIVSFEINRGLGMALNDGLKYCSYDLVARMDTDDIAFPDRFEKQVKFMESNPKIDVCGGATYEFYNSIENHIIGKKLPISHKEIYKYGKSRCPISHSTVIYRKSKVLEVGGYGPFPEDYYLWAKMLRKGMVFHNIEDRILYFRISNDLYRRRGGFKYWKQMISLQYFMSQIKYISLLKMIYNSMLHSVVILLPNQIRRYIYEHFLRTKK